MVLVVASVAAGVARRVAAVVAVVMVLGVGFSRIALGVHYLTDGLAGYVLGLAWLAAMVAAFNVVPPRHGRSPSAAGRDRGGSNA